MGPTEVVNEVYEPAREFGAPRPSAGWTEGDHDWCEINSYCHATDAQFVASILEAIDPAFGEPWVLRWRGRDPRSPLVACPPPSWTHEIETEMSNRYSLGEEFVMSVGVRRYASASVPAEIASASAQDWIRCVTDFVDPEAPEVRMVDAAPLDVSSLAHPGVALLYSMTDGTVTETGAQVLMSAGGVLVVLDFASSDGSLEAVVPLAEMVSARLASVGFGP